jgi:transaldolase
LLYVDELIGPDTVNTMPDATIAAFVDHGTVARTVDQAVDGARADLDALKAGGVDMADVSARLEDEGVTAFSKSYEELLQALEDKANERKEQGGNEPKASPQS